MAKIDRILVSIAWDAAFPLARVKALEILPSDHNPLLVDSGDNIFFGKKHFGFEKWWLEEASLVILYKKCGIILVMLRTAWIDDNLGSGLLGKWSEVGHLTKWLEK